ncbi:HAMP domain-containing sensor histidine kinase [Catalinimonas sp. 4WD22]|uniref:sensor histidine kinase n=1 Tax=Catalinimonas locisalis TaxID=3133978 RepID=UPI003101A493
MLNKFAAKKNAVLEILSHDLSRPLINIQSLSKMLSEQLSDHKQEVDQIIKMITKSSSRAIELIRSFVQQEFLESAQTKLILKRVNMVQEIRQVMEQFQDEEAKLDKHFYFESSSEDISIKIDDNKFMQVLNNLLSNAIKFTPDGGEIKVSLSETQSTILVTVSDNGIGIPKHLQNGLFERFPKARRKGLKGEPSTGLGMSIIKNIVNWHEGEIWFESEENKGSTFYIQLPKR